MNEWQPAPPALMHYDWTYNLRINSPAFIYNEVLLGGYPLYRQWQRGSKAEASHALPYIALIIVGIGSAAYHATLKYPLQLGTVNRQSSTVLGSELLASYLLLSFSSREGRKKERKKKPH